MSPADRHRAIRQRIISLSHHAKAAHMGSCLSCVEILDRVLAVSDLSPETATSPERDRIIVSKGHAVMAWYAVLEAHGLLASEVLDDYGQPDGALWAHVSTTPHAPAIDVSTGALGHGLAIGNGFALAARLQNRPHRTFVVMSDGECDEGSVWEAALFAGHHKLNSLTAVVDFNHWQSLGRVSEVIDLAPFADKWQAFGWQVHEVDGHDPHQLDAALAAPCNRPKVIIADTVKGKGLARIEDTLASHYKPALAEDLQTMGAN